MPYIYGLGLGDTGFSVLRHLGCEDKWDCSVSIYEDSEGRSLGTGSLHCSSDVEESISRLIRLRKCRIRLGNPVLSILSRSLVVTSDADATHIFPKFGTDFETYEQDDVPLGRRSWLVVYERGFGPDIEAKIKLTCSRTAPNISIFRGLHACDYRHDPFGSKTDVRRIPGVPYWRDGRWTLSLGREMWDILPDNDQHESGLEGYDHGRDHRFARNEGHMISLRRPPYFISVSDWRECLRPYGQIKDIINERDGRLNVYFKDKFDKDSAYAELSRCPMLVRRGGSDRGIILELYNTLNKPSGTSAAKDPDVSRPRVSQTSLSRIVALTCLLCFLAGILELNGAG